MNEMLGLQCQASAYVHLPEQSSENHRRHIHNRSIIFQDCYYKKRRCYQALPGNCHRVVRLYYSPSIPPSQDCPKQHVIQGLALYNMLKVRVIGKNKMPVTLFTCLCYLSFNFKNKPLICFYLAMQSPPLSFTLRNLK